MAVQVKSGVTQYSVNNQILHADGDWTILQACERTGLSIPRFCYSESLSIAGNCRMCLVEIEKSPKLMPSCAIKVADGMKIHTKTNLVKKTRESILEFLLINHPLDCPICDQGGECDLQDQAMIYGSDRGRFYEYKRSVEDKNGGPLIKTIMTRCIHCTRCIRFATEIAGIETYGTSGRGKGMEVGTYVSKLFESELSGNVIDLCPVGALTSKPYAFTVRPWELKSTESIDVLDGSGSRIRIDTKGSELMRILPASAAADVNQQWISDKTRFSYDGLKCQRLGSPMLKTAPNGAERAKLIAVSWRRAFAAIEQGLLKSDNTTPIHRRRWKHSGKRSVHVGQKMKGIIGDLVDVETALSHKNLFHGLGAPNLAVESVPGRVCVDFRSNYLLNSGLGAQYDNTDYVLLVGTNPRFEASLFNVRLRQMSYLDQNTRTTVASVGSASDLRYPIDHLGGGVRSLLALATGKHRALNKFFQAQNPLFILGSSLHQRTDCAGLRDLLNSILSLRVKVQRAMQRCSSNWRPHSIAKKHHTKRSVQEARYLDVLHAHAATVGAFDVAFNSNKMVSVADPESFYLLGADNVDVGSKTDPFIIYQGHHGQRGAQQAHVILPSTTFVEKTATYVNTEGRVQRCRPATTAPISNERDDWQIVKALSGFLRAQGKFGESDPTQAPRLPWFSAGIETSPIRITCRLQQDLNAALLRGYQSADPLPTVSSGTADEDLPKLNYVAPHLMELGLNLKSRRVSATGPVGRFATIYNSNFAPLFDNFYLSNVISRSSVTMGKCSGAFNQKQNHNFSIDR